MNKTGIEYCDATWNPVSGCLYPCRDTYCYAARLARTWLAVMYTAHDVLAGTDPVLLAGDASDPFAPRFWPHRLRELTPRQKPKRIIISDMGDLFGKWVPDDVIEQVLAACRNAPQHTYLFLTKNPGRYSAFTAQSLGGWQGWPWPPKTWLGTTTDTAIRMRKWLSKIHPVKIPGGLRFWASAEPLREDIVMNLRGHELDVLDWLVIGGQTGPELRPPFRSVSEWASGLTREAGLRRVPVFHKSNLPMLEMMPQREIPTDPPSGG